VRAADSARSVSVHQDDAGSNPTDAPLAAAQERIALLTDQRPARRWWRWGDDEARLCREPGLVHPEYCR
jgi:hypothetical protein